MRGVAGIACLMTISAVMWTSGCIVVSSGAEGSSCVLSSECNASSVCVSGQCVLGAGRQYAITVNWVTVPSVDSAGAAWDPFGGAPDPYVNVYVDNVFIGQTRYVTDNFSAMIGQSFPSILRSDSVIAFELKDDDSDAPDVIDSVQWNPGAWINVVKSGGYEGFLYQGSAAQISFSIDPIE